MGYHGEDAEVSVPTNVTSIGPKAFEGLGITRVVLPQGVRTIKSHAFSGCEDLASIVLPPSLESIDDSAFSRCKSLRNVPLPSKLKSICRWAFHGCETLSGIDLPEGIQHVSVDAFDHTDCLEEIAIPASCSSMMSTRGLDLPDELVHGDFKFCFVNRDLSCEYRRGYDGGDNFILYVSGLKPFSFYMPSERRTYLVEYRLSESVARVVCPVVDPWVDGTMEKKMKEECRQTYAREIAQQKEKEIENRKRLGCCQYCGGLFVKKWFTYRCMKCGREKDY